MKQSDLQLLAEFAGRKLYVEHVNIADRSIYEFYFSPDKNIVDAECLLDKLSKEGYSWELRYSRLRKLYYFNIFKDDYIGNLFVNKFKLKPICKAVLKLIKENKK